MFERQPVWRLRQTFQNPRAGLRNGIKNPPPRAICFGNVRARVAIVEQRHTGPEKFDDIDLGSAFYEQVELFRRLSPSEHVAPEMRPSIQPGGESLDLRQPGQTI